MKLKKIISKNNKLTSFFIPISVLPNSPCFKNSSSACLALSLIKDSGGTAWNPYGNKGNYLTEYFCGKKLNK